MKRSTIEAAVELGIRVYGLEDIPKDTIVSVLQGVTLDEVRKIFTFESSKINTDEKPTFNKFVEKYELVPFVVLDQSKTFSEWFVVDYVEEEFLPTESTSSDNYESKSIQRNTREVVHEGKYEALVETLYTLGYEAGNLEMTIGKVASSWGKLPYTCIHLRDRGKKVLFCQQSRKGTFVVDADADLSLPKSSYEEYLVAYYYKRPHIYKYLLIEKIDPEEFDRMYKNIMDSISEKYCVEEFLALEINEISDLFEGELTLNQFARYFLKIDIATTFGVEQKLNMAKKIWPEAGLKSLQEMTDEDIYVAIKKLFPEFWNLALLPISERNERVLNGYTLQNILTRLGIDARIIDSEGVWALVEKVYGYKFKDFPELIRSEYKRIHTKDEFMKLHLKQVSNFTIFDGGIGAKKIYGMIFGENISYFGSKQREELADWIWPESE